MLQRFEQAWHALRIKTKITASDSSEDAGNRLSHTVRHDPAAGVDNASAAE